MQKNEKIHSIRMSEKTWFNLMEIKLKKGYKSMDAIMQELLKRYNLEE
jgi:hypothetical protein